MVAAGPADAVLITGTVGAGKTSTAEAVGQLLIERNVPHAVIDLDQLRSAWPGPEGDPFNHAIEIANLTSVAANYRAAGAVRLILAGVLEQRSARADYERAVNGSVRVVRLLARPDELRERLRRRHADDAHDLAWHLERAPELTAILDRAQVADAEIDTTGRPISDVALAVLAAAGWR